LAWLFCWSTLLVGPPCWSPVARGCTPTA